MTTTEGNELIKIFMKNNAINSPHLTKTEDCLYHYSWAWLMDVVEKIEKGLSQFTPVCICSNGCRIDNLSGDTIMVEGGDKIFATWLAVVQFIQWYNNQKQQ